MIPYLLRFAIRIKDNMDTLSLAYEHPEAFKALPEPYQNDNCLFFWVGKDNIIYCVPKKGQEFALGYWVYMYDAEGKEWIEVDFADGVSVFDKRFQPKSNSNSKSYRENAVNYFRSKE